MLNLLSQVGMFLINMFGGIFNPSADSFSNFAWLYPIAKFLDDVFIPIIIIVAVAGAIWVIVLGVNLARAESADKAQEAKKRLINVVVAIVAVIILVFLLAFFASNVGTWFGEGGDNPFSSVDMTGAGGGTK